MNKSFFSPHHQLESWVNPDVVDFLGDAFCFPVLEKHVPRVVVFLVDD